MEYLIGLNIILIGIIWFQYYNHKHLNQGIHYIYKKLDSIVTNKTNEKLMVFTSNNELINLLKVINTLLNSNQLLSAQYSNTEITMKKMLSNISHDLKTPLTIILGYIETLNHDENLNEDEKQLMLSKISSKANEVVLLINHFFDLARLESGDQLLELSRVHLNEFCRTSLLAFYEELNSKGFTVEVSIPDTPLYIMSNEEALTRIFNNLISNVIKHSNGNIMGLHLFLDQDVVYIDIYDNGVGIAESYHHQVFDRLFTLDDARSKSYHDSGLGLSITKRLVTLLNGEIHLQSTPYEVTKFTLKFNRLIYN